MFGVSLEPLYKGSDGIVYRLSWHINGKHEQKLITRTRDELDEEEWLRSMDILQRKGRS